MLNSISPAVLVLFVLSSTIAAQFKPAEFTDASIKVFPVAELREGMRGTAKTVFRGNVPEEFGVEILGVIPNWIGPKQDMIVGKLSGANAERTFVFAGMSGSPVYIDGRLVGAISYSFPFAKEPICGITPFEQMTAAVLPPATPVRMSAVPRSFSYAELTAETWQADLAGNVISGGSVASGFGPDSRLAAVAGQTFRPIATPVTFSGISQRTLDLFAAQFEAAGILPVAAAGSDPHILPMKQPSKDTLLGGNSVVVQLARGDLQIAAAGTVTLRDGEKIYAFGHPFFGLGATSMPMAESHVVTVVPNANNSFKLAVADAPVGAMTQDRATGIFGTLGQQPRMLPVKLKVQTTRGRSEEINFESAIDEVLTPLILQAGVANTIIANERGFGDLTIDVSGEIMVRGKPSIKIARRFAGPQASAFTAAAAAVPLSALLRAGFDDVELGGITLELKMLDGGRTAVLDRVSVDRLQVRAGENVSVTAFERTADGLITPKAFTLAIPKDIAPGPLTLLVGDGTAAQAILPFTQFTPRSSTALIQTLNRLKRPDRLYAVLTRTSPGVVVGTSEMPNLPPSFLATLNNGRSAGGSKTVVQTVVAENELPAGTQIVSGSQTLTLEVVR